MTNYNIEPSNPKGSHIFSKTAVGLIVGVVVAFLIFAITIVFQTVLDSSISALTDTSTPTSNVMLGFVLILISFISSFVGSSVINGIYSMLYADKYYDVGKMFAFTITANIILFLSIAPVYMILSHNIMGLFMVLAFHTVFAVYLSYTMIEFIANPNYGSSSLVGTSIGFCIFVLVFMSIYSIMLGDTGPQLQSNGEDSLMKILFAIPPVLAYTIISLAHAIWEKIYYTVFYGYGSNIFYTPSLNEVYATSIDDTSLIDRSTTNGFTTDAGDEINVDLG